MLRILLVLSLTLVLTACSEKDHKPEIQKRYQALIQSDVKSANRNPVLQLQLEAQQYAQQENTASATDTFSLFIPKFNKTIPFALATEITYPNEKDTLGVATSQVQIKADALRALEVKQKIIDGIENTLPYFTFSNTFLKDDNLIRRFSIQPAKVEKPRASLNYGGLSASLSLKQSALGRFPFTSSGTLQSNKFVALHRKSYRTTEFTLMPFSGTFESSAQGTLHAETTPLSFMVGTESNHAKSDASNKTVKITQLTLDGKNLTSDEKIKQTLGQYTLTANALNLHPIASVNEIEFKTLSISQGITKDEDGFYQQTVNLIITPKTNLFKIAQIEHLMINDARLSISISHLSGDTINTFKDIGKSYFQAVSIEETQHILETAKKQLITSFNQDSPKLNLHLNVKTEQGEAMANLQIQATQFDAEDMKTWLDLLKAPQLNPDMLRAAIKKNFIITGNIVLPKAIVQTAQFDYLLALFTIPHLADEQNYNLTFSMQREGILINGMKIK